MTYFLPRTALLAIAALATSANAATPTYPIRAPAPQTPAAPAAPVATDENGDPIPAGRAPAPAASPIESGVLTPVRPPAAVETTALPPPPVRDAAPADEEPAAPARVERAAPPPAPVTTTKVVTLAPGKVVDIDGRPKTYTVKEGQGLDAVARAMGSTRAELARINGLKEPYRLKPGQVLKGPASRAKAYVVAPGDTIFAIARRFNVKAADLAEENGLKTSSPIRPGQKLRLPAGYRDSGPIKKTVTVTAEAPPVAAPPAKPPVRTETPPLRPAVQPDSPPPPVTVPVKPPVTTAPPVTTPVKPAPRPVTPPVSPPVKPPVTTTPTPRPETPAMTTTPSVRLDPDCSSRQPVGLSGGSGPTSDRMLPDGAPPPLTDSQITTLGRGCFAWPVNGQILSAYGAKPGGQRNDGVNIGAPAGTPVRAAAPGKVVYSGGDVPGFGVTVLIQHENGWVTVYGHLAKADVRMQQRVEVGQQIGTVGMTGGVPTPQLHFEIRYSPSPKYKAKAVDPGLVLPRNR